MMTLSRRKTITNNSRRKNLKQFAVQGVDHQYIIYDLQLCDFYLIDPQAKDRYKTAVNEILQGLAISERNVQQSPKYTMNNEQIEEGKEIN